MSGWTKFRDSTLGLVGAVAPTIAKTLGGPLAGAAVAALSKAVLGKDGGTHAEIEAALQSATPEVLAAIRKADQDFEAEMGRQGIDLERINAEDRNSARQREVQANDSWTPRILAGVVITGFFAAVGYVLSGKVGLTGEQGTLVGVLIGYVSAKADQVVSYYFGSSAGSKAKTDALTRASK
jgi:hypothetical protein